MKNYTTINKIIQETISNEQLEKLAKDYGYKESGRKLDGYEMFEYFMVEAIEGVQSFRELSYVSKKFGLKAVNHSTLGSKAKEVPYEIFLNVCKIVLHKCNRVIFYQLRLPHRR